MTRIPHMEHRRAQRREALEARDRRRELLLEDVQAPSAADDAGLAVCTTTGRPSTAATVIQSSPSAHAPSPGPIVPSSSNC